MADRNLGEGSRVAAATGAWVRGEDEAGQTLRPPKARTWSRRGHTPVVAVSGKGSGRVSIAGLVCYKPGQRSHLFYRVRIHRGRKGERRSLSEVDYAPLLTAAHQQLRAPLIVCWDNLNTHISATMQKFVTAHTDWLTVVRLPAYAPELDSSASSTDRTSSTDFSPRQDSRSTPNPHDQTPASQPLYPLSSSPFAYNDRTISSTSVSRRCRFFTIRGSNVLFRSRGTLIPTSPAASEITVFGRVPLRTFVDSRSGAAWFFSCPRCSVISSLRAVSSTFLVNSFSRPSGPYAK